MMNLYEMQNKKIGEELVETLFNHENVRIERIVSQGETTDWSTQDVHEWVILIDGTAELDVVKKNDAEMERITLTRGESYFIPAGTKHRVASTSVRPPCIWLCVFSEANGLFDGKHEKAVVFR